MKKTLYVPAHSNSSTPLPKKQKVQAQKMDEQFFASMKAMNDDLIASIPQARETEEICEDAMYCKSLIPIMKGLPFKKKRLARLKINKLFYDLEFEDDHSQNCKRIQFLIIKFNIKKDLFLTTPSH